jgi:hypothetical protein
MNGDPVPLGQDMGQFIGKTFRVIYDAKGEVLDFTPSGNLGIPVESFKQMLQSLYGAVPKGQMSVGETATLPFNMDLPLPILGAGPLKIEGEVKPKLVALVNEGDGRIAKFDQITEGRLINTTELTLPSGKVAMSLDFKINGNGTSLLNVDKGTVKTSETKINIDGKMSMPGATAATQMPNMTIKGTIKVIVSGAN